MKETSVDKLIDYLRNGSVVFDFQWGLDEGYISYRGVVEDDAVTEIIENCSNSGVAGTSDFDIPISVDQFKDKMIDLSKSVIAIGNGRIGDW